MAFDPDQYLAKKTAFDPDKFLAKKMAQVTVKDEMPEWLADTDRLKAQNLANTPEEKVKFLQGAYPDAEVKNQGDRILLRKKGESEYGVLDPSFKWGRILSKEGLRDAGDIISDIGQGASEAVGAAAGAAGGTMLAPGAGTLAGIMAGSGVASGAFSDAKERLAAMLGVKDYDGGKVLTDAAWGAALPGVFAGVGKGIKYGAQKAAPRAYAWVTGMTPDKLKLIADKGEELASASSNSVLSKYEGIGDMLRDSLKKMKGDFSGKYGAANVDAAPVGMGPVVKVMDDAIEAAAQRVKNNPNIPAFQKELDELVEFRGRQFGSNASPLSANIDDSLKLNDMLNESISWVDDAGQRVGSGLSDAVETVAKDSKRALKGQVNVATGGQRAAVDAEYVPFVDEADFIRKYFSNPKKIQSSLEQLGKGKNAELMGGFDRLPKETKDAILKMKDELDVIERFSGINKNRILTSDNFGEAVTNAAVGKTPIERILQLAGGAAGYASGGGYLGSAAGLFAGRKAGQLVASPKSILRAAKTGKAVGQGMDSLEEFLKAHPEYMKMLYGASAAATQD